MVKKMDARALIQLVARDEIDVIVLQTTTWLLVFDASENTIKWTVAAKPSQLHAAVDPKMHIPTGISMQGYICYYIREPYAEFGTSSHSTAPKKVQIPVAPFMRLLLVPDNTNPYATINYERFGLLFEGLLPTIEKGVGDKTTYDYLILAKTFNVLKGITITIPSDDPNKKPIQKRFSDYILMAMKKDPTKTTFTVNDLANTTYGHIRKAINLALQEVNSNYDLDGAWRNVKARYDNDHPPETTLLKVAPPSPTQEFEEGYLHEAWEIIDESHPLSFRQVNVDAMDTMDSASKRQQQAAMARLYGIPPEDILKQGELTTDEFLQELTSRLADPKIRGLQHALRKIMTVARPEAYRLIHGIDVTATSQSLKNTQVGQLRDLLLTTSQLRLSDPTDPSQRVTVQGILQLPQPIGGG